jgi:hypothetical protein
VNNVASNELSTHDALELLVRDKLMHPAIK